MGSILAFFFEAWSRLGRAWRRLGRAWRRLGRAWSRLGTILERLGAAGGVLRRAGQTGWALEGSPGQTGWPLEGSPGGPALLRPNPARKTARPISV